MLHLGNSSCLFNTFLSEAETLPSLFSQKKPRARAFRQNRIRNESDDSLAPRFMAGGRVDRDLPAAIVPVTKEGRLPERKNSFAVIGLGAFGSTVAVDLARHGAYVLGVDLDGRRVGRVAEDLAEAKILDATDEEALREAGFDRYGAVLVAIGEDLEASILATLNARLVGCRTVWVKARDRTHHRILTRLGADRVILPEIEMGQHVAQMMHNPLVRDYASLGNGYFAMSLDVPPQIEGRALGTLELARYNLQLLTLMRGTHRLDLAANPALRTEDHLLLLGRTADLRRFGDTL